MFYEVTDTKVTMKDVSGTDLGFHPVYVIEADSPDEALQKWSDETWHDRDTEGVTIKEVG